MFIANYGTRQCEVVSQTGTERRRIRPQSLYSNHMMVGSGDLHGRRHWGENLSRLRIIILKGNWNFPFKILIFSILTIVNIYSQLLKVGNKMNLISGYFE